MTIPNSVFFFYLIHIHLCFFFLVATYPLYVIYAINQFQRENYLKWLGKIPTQLQDLSYAEQLLIARIAIIDV